MKMVLLIAIAIISASASARQKSESPETAKCVQDFALNAALPTEFPGLGETQNPAGDRVSQNIMDKETMIHQALASFCEQNGNSTNAPSLPETSEISYCVQGLALDVSLPREFPGDSNDPVGAEVYQRIMDKMSLTHRALVSYCAAHKN